jgi:hypothetical protein
VQVAAMNEVVASTRSLSELAESLRGVLRGFHTGAEAPLGDRA